MKHIKISPQRYRWVIVAASFLMVFVCLGFCSSSKSLYLAAITEALGIKRSLFSINDSCRYIATAVVNLFFGALCARFGRKRLIAAGFACLIASMLLYAYAPNIYLFYLGGVLLGLGLAWTTTTMVGSIVHRWCPAHAGKIMGLILAANGVGAAVATQIVTPIIYAPGDAFGYRNAYKLVALILAVTAGIVLALYREPPEKIPESTSAEKEPQQAESGQSTARGARFYLLLVCVFLTGFILQSTTGVSAAHMKDVGLDAGYVAAVVSAHALSLTVCKFLTGVIHDHAGLRKTVLLCDCAAITVLILLAEVTATPTGRVLAMTYGILSALALPLETIILPLIAQDLFQGPQYNKMLGIIVSVNTAGYAVGTPIANLTFDCLGTYQPMLLASACVMAGVTICIQQLLRRRAAKGASK
ncbi:MAG: MFS transporter [Clostridiales bacterium]|nr:MFS transporter [Clostridiales bacterium]